MHIMLRVYYYTVCTSCSAVSVTVLWLVCIALELRCVSVFAVVDHRRSGVVYNFEGVCLSVCQTITFESLDVGSSFPHILYISSEYGSSSYNMVKFACRMGFIFSERKLMFMFAICRRPSVCLSSVVCNVHAPYSGY